MSYPDALYHGTTGEVSATYRPADHKADLTIGPAVALHYLATGASTDGRFGLYRWDAGPQSGGAAPHFHRTMSESFFVMSGRVEIGLESLDRYLHGGIAVRSPQIAALEAHGVEPLRVVALAHRGAVGKHMGAVHALDRADLAAHIARQPRVGRRMDVLGAHAVARLVARRPLGGPARNSCSAAGRQYCPRSRAACRQDRCPECRSRD